MKSKNIVNKFFIAGALMLCAGMTSCDDYLTVLPSDRITEDDFWQNKADLNNVRSAAYKQMATGAVTDRIVYWGELRSDNLAQNNMGQTNIELLRKGVLHPTEGMFDWAPFYTGINYCNMVLEKGEVMTEPGKEVDPSFRRGDWLPIKAEMLSMRALYYFYLVRAYRDVPFVSHSISTDAEAKRSRDKATKGAVILSSLINDLEQAKTFAADDYSNAIERKGRFTKRGVHALLADLYLWHSALVKHAVDKKDSLMVAATDSTDARLYTQSELDVISKEDLHKVIENCDFILNELQEDYEEDLILHPEWKEDKDRNEHFPYMLYISSKGTKGIFDNIYSNIWGNKNSEIESVFELQFDGNILKNSTYNRYLSEFSSGNLSPKSMVGSAVMTQSAGSNYTPEKGFGKGDIRLVETFAYTPADAQRAPYRKNIAKSITISDVTNVTDMENVADPQYRAGENQDANWPVYRLTDVMLMKAEAIARLNAVTTAPKDKDAVDNANEDLKQLIVGFDLVNSIYQRCNPGVEIPGTAGAGDAISERMRDAETYVIKKTSSDLLALVYQERQREFVGEGKRWFDLVRQVEASNDTKGTLSSFITLQQEVASRLRSIYAMYVPIYSEELKVNGVEFGGGLVQNPVWDKYTVK